MRKISKLAALSAADLQVILRLCETSTCDSVAAMVARPRAEGGLDLVTNRCALSRFVSTFHPEAELAKAIQQIKPPSGPGLNPRRSSSHSSGDSHVG